MRISVVAMGSRGDVQPLIALGRGLKQAGHALRLVTHENFEALARAQGLDFAAVHGNVQDVAETPEMRALLDRGDFPALLRKQAEYAMHYAPRWAADSLAGSSDADLIIAGFGSIFLGLALAEKLKIPLIQAHVLPFHPTRDFPGVLLPPGLPLPRLLNRFSHRLTQQLLWMGTRDADRIMREQVFDLPPLPRSGPYRQPALRNTPAIYGFSEALIRQPTDWGPAHRVTGYWFLDAGSDWNPPAALRDFLAAGAAPVCIGFGSMSNRDPERSTAVMLESLEIAGQRAILLSGWEGLRAHRLPENVFMIDSAPHDWLFPRMAALVHHGGAGTTAAGLRAGKPTLITPYFGDQPFWGQRVAELGAGPVPLNRSRLSAARLAQGIEQMVQDQAMRARAAAIGGQIQAEDGVSRAVEQIEAWLQ